MERHKCKLCTRTFANGRALGGHMKAHLATLPLPPKPQPFQTDESFSFSYSSSQSEQQQQQQQEAEQVVLTHSPSRSQSLRESEEKGVIYGLRGNPKKSFRVADPEFSFAAPPPDTAGSDDVVIVQDRESETESNKNPARQRRSKRNRNRNSTVSLTPNLQKKPKLSFVAEPPAEQEPVVSSVSDASKEEDVAMCLMMLSRDTWKKKNNNNNNAAKQEQHQELEQEEQKGVADEFKVKRVRGKKHQHECERCGKKFRSSRALGSHRSICCRGESGGGGGGDGERIFECPFCSKVFGSGQALGGHKRSHLMGMNAATSSSTANNDDSVALLKSRESFIDLNLPAPVEEEKDDDDDDDDDELSVVSDA